MERNLVHLNFSDGPDGTVNFGLVIPVETDKESRAAILAFKVLRYLESEAVSKSFEVIDGCETTVANLPGRTLYDA